MSLWFPGFFDAFRGSMCHPWLGACVFCLTVRVSWGVVVTWSRLRCDAHLTLWSQESAMKRKNSLVMFLQHFFGVCVCVCVCV